MANLPAYGYGSSATGATTTLGYGAPSPTLSISQGDMVGGDVYILVGASPTIPSIRDVFTSDDTTKWSTIVSGTGSAAVGSGLVMTIANAGSVVRRTLHTYQNFDVRADFSYDNSIESLYPTQPITFFRLTAILDTNNKMSISSKWDPSLGPIIEASVVSGGVVQHTSYAKNKSNSNRLRLVRFGGRVQAWVGASRLADYTGWIIDPIYMELGSDSAGSARQLSTKVSLYDPVALVTFGDNISTITVDSRTNKIVGHTPSSSLPHDVDIYVHTNVSSTKVATSFTYIAPQQLTVSGQSESIVVANDNALRDTSSTLPGLRL